MTAGPDAPVARRHRLFEQRHVQPGQAPGLVKPPAGSPPPVIRVIDYTPDGFDEGELEAIDELEPWLERPGVLWLDVAGLGDASILRDLADRLSMHRLALEDVVNVHQRPKLEEYADTLFVVARVVESDENLASEQISMHIEDGLVVTFQTDASTLFDPVRARIRSGKGKIRGRGADYLAYALLDAAVDAHFPILEAIGTRLEDIEDAVSSVAREAAIHDIHRIKRDVMMVRRVLWPSRDMLHAMLREGTPTVTDETRPYLRDCYDHAVQLMDLVENFREVSSGLMDLHLSMVSYRMNEVMKVLTIISTIFIPLSFVAGLYGMNFDTENSEYNLPELGWRFGYFACLGVMSTIAIAMLLYFRRIGWIGRRNG